MSKQTDLINVTDAITVSGSNVGIGTSSPDAPLNIAFGSNEMLRLQNTTAGVGSGYISFYENGGTRTAWIGNSSANNTNFQITNESSDGFVSIRTNNSERMRIDSAGRVTMPYQPAFSAGHNSNAFNTPSGSAQVIYNYKMFDIGNNYNTSNGRFTAPVSGTYVFTHTATSRQASAIVFEVKVYQNGTERKRQFSKGPNDAHGTSTTVMLYCSAGDYIESRGYWGTGVNLSGNLDMSSSADQGTLSSFSGHLIG